MEYLGAWGTLIREKNFKSKISCQTPFKQFYHCKLLEECFRELVPFFTGKKSDAVVLVDPGRRNCKSHEITTHLAGMKI
jgi:hypothetical protein